MKTDLIIEEMKKYYPDTRIKMLGPSRIAFGQMTMTVEEARRYVNRKRQAQN